MTPLYPREHQPDEKTTDRIFELPFYDKMGRINVQKLVQLSLLIYLVCIVSYVHLWLLFSSGIDLFDNYLVEMEHLFRWGERRFYELKAFGIGDVSPVEWSVLIVGALLPVIPIFFLVRRVLFRSQIQSNLASAGLEHYFLYKSHPKEQVYIFKLLKGQRMAYDTFVRQFENLRQLFGTGDIEYERFENDKVKVRFIEELIDIPRLQENSVDASLARLIQPKKLLLGITNLKGDTLFATPKEEGCGILNAHWLIVGASGSGKSVSVKSFCLNFLHPDNYRHIDKIYIINYKRSSDYNFLKPLAKVEYAQEVKDGLRHLKKIQLDMFNRYRYNSVHNDDNFTAYQTIVIIDEIQTLPELLDSKSLHKIERNSIQESLSILEQLGSKARASNISMMVILQKADAVSLPSTAFRQNLRNRFMLKQENLVSASMVINSDLTEKANIKPLELKKGQFIYYDTLTNDIKRGLALYPDMKVDYDALNCQGFDETTQRIIDEVHSYKASSIAAIAEQTDELETLQASGKKTYFDSFEDIDDEITSFNLKKPANAP